jgi:16S rRNA (cytidine1402-2'-O)-methyltransferase
MTDSTQSAQLGTLYVVATPIGNLGDITYRAVDVLRQVGCIIVEDSRHSAKLLQHYNISASVSVIHDHNERNNSIKLVEKLQQGVDLALISDAGTPLISDPGYWLVNLAIQHSIKVVPIPGASASIAALAVSGLPSDRFCFEGFLPAKKQARATRLQELVHEPRTVIFYEAPHRIIDALQDMVSVFSADRQGVIARELTKTFETVLRAPLGELLAIVENDNNQQKGEFVVLVHGSDVASSYDQRSQDQLLQLLLGELPIKKAAALASQITGVKKNQLYDRALELKSVK